MKKKTTILMFAKRQKQVMKKSVILKTLHSQCTQHKATSKYIKKNMTSCNSELYLIYKIHFTLR